MAESTLQTYEVAPGIHWVEIPFADLRVLCGCPAEVVKHLARRGFIRNERRGSVNVETGPNAILLSDLPIQNGAIANMAEFPVLQMLYRQGMLLPGHPNNTGAKPLLLGSALKLRHQLDYIHRGNYGLSSIEEIIEAGIEPAMAEQMMAVKLAFAFGRIRPPAEFLDTIAIGDEPVELRPGVTMRRFGINRFEFCAGDQRAEVDLNLPAGRGYEIPYSLQHHEVSRAYFSVIHTGEGDGWDINRPSMSSVLMFQGRCYVVDAPPNIEHILLHLGIDLSEVDGLFHTHAHDDHFAGLATLMRTGHRIKYYATPLVRLSVSKKLASLTGLEENRFQQFFEICDLHFDRWNDCDGLQVMPFYSPHPVENNIFLFRALGPDGYRSYAHWADLTSLPVLAKMVRGGPTQPSVSQSFIDKIQQNYQTPADIKKLDIGGGMIHGRAEDFATDPSGRLVLAHIARPLTDAEREIGSTATFGAEDILIPSERDYRRQRAYRHLLALFPEMLEHRIQALLNTPLMDANAGSILLRHGRCPEHVELLLTGAVEFIHSDSGVRFVLAAGALVGEHALFDDTPSQGSWRALSHAVLLRIPLSLFRTILAEEGMTERMREEAQGIERLRRSRLLGERIGHTTLKRIAKHGKILSLEPGMPLPSTDTQAIYLISKGKGELTAVDGRVIEHLDVGDFFGEETFFSDGFPAPGVRILTAMELIRIAGYPLDELPVVLWKLLETRARRRNLLTTPDSP